MKKWYLSKTVILNLLIAVVGVLETQIQLLQPFVGQGGYAALLILIPIVNIVLRTITTQALTK